jgi:hypothetical protein
VGGRGEDGGDGADEEEDEEELAAAASRERGCGGVDGAAGLLSLLSVSCAVCMRLSLCQSASHSTLLCCSLRKVGNMTFQAGSTGLTWPKRRSSVVL